MLNFLTLHWLFSKEEEEKEQSAVYVLFLDAFILIYFLFYSTFIISFNSFNLLLHFAFFVFFHIICNFLFFLFWTCHNFFFFFLEDKLVILQIHSLSKLICCLFFRRKIRKRKQCRGNDQEERRAGNEWETALKEGRKMNDWNGRSVEVMSEAKPYCCFYY